MEKYLKLNPPRGVGGQTSFFEPKKKLLEIERSASPFLRRIYSLTLSSNLAKSRDAYKAYKYIICQLPMGHFMYVHEISKYGKYHVHGIMEFTYDFNFSNLMLSRETRDGWSYDVHIRYDELATIYDLREWFGYCSKLSSKWRQIDLVSQELRPYRKFPKTCIRECKWSTRYKKLIIKGIY